MFHVFVFYSLRVNVVIAFISHFLRFIATFKSVFSLPLCVLWVLLLPWNVKLENNKTRFPVQDVGGNRHP